MHIMTETTNFLWHRTDSLNCKRRSSSSPAHRLTNPAKDQERITMAAAELQAVTRKVHNPALNSVVEHREACPVPHHPHHSVFTHTRRGHIESVPKTAGCTEHMATTESQLTIPNVNMMTKTKSDALHESSQLPPATASTAVAHCHEAKIICNTTTRR
jgi:hypothetical protein